MCEENLSNGQSKEVIDAVTGLVKAVPVYQDAIQPAAKEVGKSLELVAKSVNVALSPLKAVVWGYAQIEKFLFNDLSKRLSNTPEEDIITPKLSIAGPMMETIRFVGDEEELKDMFANLLANSMDRKTESLAHPAFVEILKNMTSDEARIMKFFAINSSSQPILDLESSSSSEIGNRTFQNKFSIIGEKAECVNVDATPNYLDNLIRLGLLEAPFGMELTEAELYKPLCEHSFVKKLEQGLEMHGRKLEITKRLIMSTNLGKQFCKACVVEKADSSLPDLFG